jgi:hypothetical protein
MAVEEDMAACFTGADAGVFMVAAAVSFGVVFLVRVSVFTVTGTHGGGGITATIPMDTDMDMVAMGTMETTTTTTREMPAIKTLAFPLPEESKRPWPGAVIIAAGLTA